MNKNFANRILLCLVAMTMACMPEVKASCVNSGFGIGLTLGTQKNTVKFNADNLNKLSNNTRTDLLKKLNDAIAATNKRFEKQNTKDTEMIDGGEDYPLTTYEEDPDNADQIKGATADKLGDAKEIKLKTKKFNSDNPTKYRIADSSKKEHGKYDKDGMCNDANGTAVKKPILVNPGVVANNGYDDFWAETASNNNTLDTRDFARFAKDGSTFYFTPKDGFILGEMTKDWADDGSTNPTHVLLNDLSGDKTTYAFLTSILGNSSTLAEYKKIFSGDEFFTDENKIYIDTVKHKDLGLSDTFVSSAINTLSPNTVNSQTFKDVSKWSFDVGAIIFYQYRIYDWFIRGGLFGNFPIANKKVSIIESENQSKDDSKKKSSDNDFSLEHSFDVGAQILGGYNITQAFAIVFGLEFGYSKWKLNNLDKLSSVYSALGNSVLARAVVAGNTNALDDYNKSLKDMGLSDKEKKIGKWFWRGVIGFEYNFSNFIVGLQGFFGPDTKLMKASNNRDLGDLKVSNMGARLTLAYKF